MKNSQNIDEILSVLRCVECGETDLIIAEDDAAKWKGYIFRELCKSPHFFRD
jgi:ferredoxin-like protein FixX